MKIKFEINKDLVINISSYYDKNCKVIRIYLIITIIIIIIIIIIIEIILKRIVMLMNKDNSISK